MPTAPLSFGITSAPGRFGPDGGCRLVNAYPEQLSSDAKAPFAFMCRPGLMPFANLFGAGGLRGCIDLDGVAYVVCGGIVNKVTSAGVVTNVGTFAGTGYVWMARNRKASTPQIALVSEGVEAILENDSVSLLTDEHLPASIAVCNIGGYFVFAHSDGRYTWSGIDDSTVDALDFATAEANPDGLNGILARNQEIVLLGDKSIEFHALVGGANVFERVQQTTIELGCLSGPAAKTINGVPIFPASDATVRMLSDYSPERISTHDVERDIDALTAAQKAAMTAHTFSLAGHQFYVLNSSQWTWACDLATRSWTQWVTADHDRWISEGLVEIGGLKLTGHYDDNVLYRVSSDHNEDGDESIIWKIVSGPVGAFPGRIIADEVYLDLLPGVGLNSDSSHGSNPKVMLRTSDDDGASWSDEMTAPVGKIGEKKREVRFRNLGATGEDGMRFEIAMSAPVSRCLTRGAVRFTPLRP